jgi:hypothetical protein
MPDAAGGLALDEERLQDARGVSAERGIAGPQHQDHGK